MVLDTEEETKQQCSTKNKGSYLGCGMDSPRKDDSNMRLVESVQTDDAIGQGSIILRPRNHNRYSSALTSPSSGLLL